MPWSNQSGGGWNGGNNNSGGPWGQGQPPRGGGNPPDLEDIIETEWRQHLIDLVLERLKKSFSGKAMEVFTMTLDGHSVEQIAASMELSKDSVYVLRNRVNSRFRKEVRQLRTHLEFHE